MTSILSGPQYVNNCICPTALGNKKSYERLLLFKWSHCSSFNDWKPVDIISGCLIFIWVAVIWLKIRCKHNKQINSCPGGWFNIKMSSYQYRKSHCGDKTVVRSSYLHNGISYTGKMSPLYWIRAQVTCRICSAPSGTCLKDRAWV